MDSNYATYTDWAWTPLINFHRNLYMSVDGILLTKDFNAHNKKFRHSMKRLKLFHQWSIKARDITIKINKIAHNVWKTIAYAWKCTWPCRTKLPHWLYHRKCTIDYLMSTGHFLCLRSQKYPKFFIIPSGCSTLINILSLNKSCGPHVSNFEISQST